MKVKWNRHDGEDGCMGFVREGLDEDKMRQETSTKGDSEVESGMVVKTEHYVGTKEERK